MGDKLQVRPIVLFVSAVVGLVLAVAPILHAQTPDSDINLSRLAEAVKAINESQLAPAEDLLNSVLKTSPGDADALNLLGVVRAKQSRATEAERLFRRALARSPAHLSAHINLGELLLNNNRAAEAMPILLRAHKLAPARPEINLNLARLYANKDLQQQTHDYLSLVPRENFSDDYFLLMVKSLIALKRKQDLPALIAEFREFGVDAPETHAEFALQLAKGGFNDDALQILNAAYQKTPTSFPVLYGLGLTTAGLKQLFNGHPENRIEWLLRTDGILEAWQSIDGRLTRLDNGNLATKEKTLQLGIGRRGEKIYFMVNREVGLESTIRGLPLNFKVMLYGFGSSENNWESVTVQTTK